MPAWNFRRDVSIRDIQNEFDRLIDRLWHGGINTAPLDGQDWAPPVEVIDESDRYVILAEIPGLNPDDVEVSVTDGAVVLSGTKPAPPKTGEQWRLIRDERRYGSFRRAIDLPDPVDDSRVQATCALGVLTISLPKQVVAEGRRVPVESSEPEDG